MVSVNAKYQDKNVEIDRNGDVTSATIPYIVTGVGSEDEALTETLANTAASYGGAARASLSIDRRLTPTEFVVSVRYATTTKDGPGTGTITGSVIPASTKSFSTIGGTEKVYVAKSTSKYPANAPFGGNVIGWDGEKAQGADIPASAFAFQETHYFPRSMITYRWRRRIGQLSVTVNNAAFRGCEGGEVLFLGCEGAERANSASGDDDYIVELQFRFLFSPNLTGLTIGGQGGVGGVKKIGWWYLDVFNEPVFDAASQIVTSKPKYVYVHEIFRESNFALLGIGTA